jgi:hypothetical protein
VLLNNNITLLVVGDLINMSLVVGLGDHDLHAAADPANGNVTEDVDETDSRDDVADASALSVGNCSLNRGEDCSARNTHDKDTGGAASMATKVGSTHSEDGRVHGSLEEEDGNQDTDTGDTLTSAAVGSESNGAARVDNHDEVGAQEHGKTSSDESTNGEGDEGIAKHGAGLAGRDTTVLVGIVDEEGSNSDLGTDVTELSKEGEPHVVLLPDGAMASMASLVLNDGLGDLRELGEEEEDTDSGTSTGDSEVDILDVGEAVGVITSKEELGSDQGSNERGDTVPRLAELETS